MPEENCRDIIPGYLGSAYLLALCLGVRHSRSHTLPYHSEFQLAEYTCHLYEKAYRGFLAMEQVMADDKLYYRLGSMNLTGTGTEADLEQARYYFEKAVELGNADALYGLGRLCLKPEFPDYDPAMGVVYLEQAVEKDHAFAKYQLGKGSCFSLSPEWPSNPVQG